MSLSLGFGKCYLISAGYIYSMHISLTDQNIIEALL